MNRAEAERRVSTQGWLARQPPAFQRATLDRAQLVERKAREYFYHTGDGPGGVYGIVGGGVGVYGQGADTVLRLGHVVRRGVWFGTAPALLGSERLFSYRAMEPTLAFHLPLGQLRQLSGQNQEFARLVGSLAQIDAITASRVAADLLIPDSSRRLAATILRTADADDDQPKAPRRLKLTQAELGEMANVSRRLVSGVVKRFTANAWIEAGYNELTIVNPQALVAFVSSNE